MQTENKKNSGSNAPRRRTKYLPPLSAEEMQFLLIKKYINEEEVQRILGVCQRTVYNYIKSGQLIATYIGSKKHFDILDIHEGLNDNKGKGRGGGRK